MITGQRPPVAPHKVIGCRDQPARDVPAAIRLDAYASYETAGDGFSDLKTPWGLKLLSGGSVAPSVGYYFYFFMSERGEVAGIEDAYLHFNDLGGHPLDVMVGQFQISDPMLKRELRLSFEDYEAYRYRPGESHTQLTYDRGVMVIYDTPFGLGLTGQVVNGNGKGAADEDTRRFDGDRDKGYSLRAAADIGPLGVGLFGYWTKERVANEADSFEAENEVSVLGPDVNLGLGEKAHLAVQYLWRRDTAPMVDVVDLEAHAVTAELVYLPQGADGRHSLTALWNWIDADTYTAGNLETWTGSYSWLYRRNLRLIGEVTWNAEIEETRFIAGVTSGF